MNDKLVKLSDAQIRDLLYMEECAKIALPSIIQRCHDNEKVDINLIAKDAWNIAKAMYNERVEVIKILAKEYSNE